jgi:hypothetical protein
MVGYHSQAKRDAEVKLVLPRPPFPRILIRGLSPLAHVQFRGCFRWWWRQWGGGGGGVKRVTCYPSFF